jgi:hypothetical protein
MDTAPWKDAPMVYPTQYRTKTRPSPPAPAKSYTCRMGRFRNDKMVNLTWDGVAAGDHRAEASVRLVRLALTDPHHRIAGTMDRFIIHTP